MEATLDLEATLDQLQQLPAELTEYSECTITCYYSCWSTGRIGPCDITTTIS